MGAPVGVVGEDSGESAVRLLASEGRFGTWDGRPHYREPELYAYFVTGEEPPGGRGVQGLYGYLNPGQLGCRREYLRQRGFAVGSGDGRRAPRGSWAGRLRCWGAGAGR